MPEKPDGNSDSDKALPPKGQEPSRALKQASTDTHSENAEHGSATEPASQKLAESAWAPGSESHIANMQPLPPGFPQPELVSGNLILEGQVIKPGTLTPAWDLTDEEVNQRAKLVQEALERRSFLGLGGPDPDIAQMTNLLEGLKLSDRRAIEMVLNKEKDFRQELESKLVSKPTEFNKLIAVLDRPDKSPDQALDNPQAIFYARKVIESLKEFSKEGVDAAVNLLQPLSQAEKQQIEKELDAYLQMPFRDWLKRGLNNEGVARVEATLDQPDNSTDYKGSFKVLMAGLKDNWSADKENAILHMVSGMDGKEIRQSELFKELTNTPYLSQSAKDALDVLLTGRDKWTHDPFQAKALADLALKSKNLEMFKDAMQSEHARKYYRSVEGAAEIDRTFSGIFDTRQKEIAHDYAELNDTKLLTDLQMYQFSLSPSREAITQRLESASYEEKKLFQQGRDLADLRPKETAEEKAANTYYLKVYDALRGASKYDSQQLKQWTGILLGSDSQDRRIPEDPKQQALRQVVDDNRLGLTGLDAVRHLETALRLNPELAKDKELKAAFAASVKRIAESSTASSIGAAVWKEMTDINNFSPLTALTNGPNRLKRQEELSQGLVAGSFEQLQKQLLTHGQLTLEQKLHIAGSTKLTADDLLSLQQGEKERLLKGGYPQQLQEKVFGGKEQTDFVKSILSKQDKQLTELDQVRAFALSLGNGSQSIESLLGGMKAEQRKELSDQYFDKYKSAMNADILSQVKDPVDKARMQQYLRHANSTPEQKLVDAQVEQTKHASGLDAISEMYSPDQRMANRYARVAETFYRQVKDGLTDTQKEQLDKLPADKQQEIAQSLMKYQSALKKYWSAQKDYTHNKEEMAEQLADAALTAGAVIGSIAQPELSPALLARAAALSAAGRLGIKQAVMDKDFDTSTASFQKELFKGGLAGVINTAGGMGTGKLISMGKFTGATTNAAEKTIADLSANQTVKSVLAQDAEKILSGKLEKTTMEKVFGRQSTCLANAKEVAKTIAPKANEEQLKVIAQTIQAHSRQEVLNTVKGTLWHEGDQFAQSITASVAGSAFAELSSTAAGYESPESLWKRLEMSSQSAIAGGALFHVGFKAVGAGVQGVGGMLIGKDKQGHLFAGPGAQVRTAEGKEISVGKEPYYFKDGDNLVEFTRDTRPQVDAPPFLQFNSTPRSMHESGGRTQMVAAEPVAIADTATTKSKLEASYDKIPVDYRRKLADATSDCLDFLHSHYEMELKFQRQPEDKEIIKQLISFIDLTVRTRERLAQVPRRIARSTSTTSSTVEHAKPQVAGDPSPHAGLENVSAAESINELSAPRTRRELPPEAIRELSAIYKLSEADIRFTQSRTSHGIKAQVRSYEQILEANTLSHSKSMFENILTLTQQLDTQRKAHFQHKYPGLRPGIIDATMEMDFNQLSEYKQNVLKPFAAKTELNNVSAMCKEQWNLITDLQAEHLSQTLDENLAKRTETGTPGASEEIRLLWQYNLRDLTESINSIHGHSKPIHSSESHSELIGKLDRMKGIPKPTGEPVQITGTLVAAPWRDGEILSSKNGPVTVNDRIGQTSRTINSAGQLIECLDRTGALWHFKYANRNSNEIISASCKVGDNIVKYHSDGTTLSKTIEKPDGTTISAPLDDVIRIETRADGSQIHHKLDSFKVIGIDGSIETHANGKRTEYHANLALEETRLRRNFEESLIVDFFSDRNLADLLTDGISAESRQKRFNKLLSEFEKVAETNEYSKAEQAKFYKHINRLLSEDNDSVIKSREGRRDLAEQVLYNATHARLIDQGRNNTCNVTTLEKRCWARSPATMAQFAADVAEFGKFTTTSGQVLDMTKFSHGIRPDIEARKSLKFQRTGEISNLVVDGERSWLSQMTQMAMVNSYWQKVSRTITPEGVISPRNVAFDVNQKLLGKIDSEDVQELFDDKGKRLKYWPDDKQVYDQENNLLSIKPKDAVYDADRVLIGVINVDQISPLFGKDGRVVQDKLQPGDVIYDSPEGMEVIRATLPGDIQFGQIGNPKVTSGDNLKLRDHGRLSVQRFNSRNYCKSNEGGKVYSCPRLSQIELHDISSEFTGNNEVFSIRRRPQAKEWPSIIDISTKEELGNQIKKWQDEKNLPGILRVHAGKPPFNKLYDANDVTSGMDHSWHVINVWGIENGMVDTTNQWGKAHNIKIPIEELFEAMSDPTGEVPP